MMYSNAWKVTWYHGTAFKLMGDNSGNNSYLFHQNNCQYYSESAT